MSDDFDDFEGRDTDNENIDNNNDNTDNDELEDTGETEPENTIIVDDSSESDFADDGGRIITADLSKEMETSYLNYSMSVIVARALPDVRDGLKPVHRRILYDMNELGIKSSGEFKKSARIVGDVLGKYHPHGDASVYDALVRLAQDFSLRYPVVKPHGNFGSIDGDPAAAMRYTEAKMSVFGEEMLTDCRNGNEYGTA